MPKTERSFGKPVCLVGRDEFIEFACRGRFQHLHATLPKVGQVEEPLLDVENSLYIQKVFLTIEGHLQENHVLSRRDSEGPAMKQPFDSPLQN